MSGHFKCIQCLELKSATKIKHFKVKTRTLEEKLTKGERGAYIQNDLHLRKQIIWSMNIGLFHQLMGLNAKLLEKMSVLKYL